MLQKNNPVIEALSTKAVFPHSIPKQKQWNTRQGVVKLTEKDILENLWQLHNSVVWRVFTQFPNELRINSGYRSSTGGSQHNSGMAVDLQLIKPNGDPTRSIEIAKWMQKYCDYDQLAIEYSASNPKRCWIHCSFVPAKYGKNRYQIYTWDAGRKNIVVETGKFIDRNQ